MTAAPKYPLAKPMSVNELMLLSADGDSSATNVIDMIDANESGALTASDEQLGIWYEAAKVQP